MPEHPSCSAGDSPADAGGIAQLVVAALAAPVPAPEAERASEERVRAQFRDGALTPRPLHPLPPAPAPSSPVLRLARALSRLLRR